MCHWGLITAVSFNGFKQRDRFIEILTLLLLNTTYPVLANSVDPGQLASEEANWSGSALFVIKYVNFYKKKKKKKKKTDQVIWLAGNSKWAWHLNLFSMTRYEPAHDKTYNKTCATSNDSGQPVYPPTMARVLVYPSSDSLAALERTCDQRRLWSDCADAQADLSLRCPHKSYRRFCRMLTHILMPYHTFPGIWTSPLYSLLTCLKLLVVR